MLIKAFEHSEFRFISHPENKYAFGLVAVDLALHLGSTASGSRFTRSVDEDYKGVHNMDTPGGTQQVVVLWEPGVYEVLSELLSTELRASYFTGDCLKTDLRPTFGLTSPL